MTIEWNNSGKKRTTCPPPYLYRPRHYLSPPWPMNELIKCGLRAKGVIVIKGWSCSIVQDLSSGLFSLRWGDVGNLHNRKSQFGQGSFFIIAIWLNHILDTSLFILAGEGEIGVALAGSSSSLDSIISTEQIFLFATLRVCWSALGISKNVGGLDCCDDCLGEVAPPLEVFCWDEESSAGGGGTGDDERQIGSDSSPSPVKAISREYILRLKG